MNIFKKKVAEPSWNEFEIYTLQERLQFSERLKNKYPDLIPINIKKKFGDKILQDIDKHRYLIPKNLPMSNLLFIIRKKITLLETQALFVFVEKNKESFLVASNTIIGEIYQQHKSNDNFLYLVYTTENTFG
jgi:GABA(A) receptor-associated protein